MTTRAEVVACARVQAILGTRFHHMGRSPGVYLDCAGLIICVMRELGLCAPDFDVPAYTRAPDGTTMLSLCEKHMTCIASDDMSAGDVIVLASDVHPQHLGILGDYRYGGFSIIHAYIDARPGRVVETRLMFTRKMRLVAAYRLPGVA